MTDRDSANNEESKESGPSLELATIVDLSTLWEAKQSMAR